MLMQHLFSLLWIPCDENNTSLNSPLHACMQNLNGSDHDRCLTDDADAHAHAECTPPPLSALREYSVKLRARLQEVSHCLWCSTHIHITKLTMTNSLLIVQEALVLSTCTLYMVSNW